MNLPDPVIFYDFVHMGIQASPSSKVEVIYEVTKVLLEHITGDGSFRLDIIFCRSKRKTRKLIGSKKIVGMKTFIAVFCPYAAYSRTLSMQISDRVG